MPLGIDRAVIVQDHLLLSWLTAVENVALAVEKVFAKSKSRAECRDWVLYNLELVQMTGTMHARAGELPGCMKHHVGIARTIAMQLPLLLTDQPFGALDALTRASLQSSWQSKAALNNTVLMITHDVQ